MKLQYTIVGIFIFLALNTKANIKLPVLFQSNMVLQRDQPCPIWGDAGPNERISIRLNNHTYTGIATNGKWKIILPAQPAGGPFQIEIQGNNTIVLENVLFGDLWICSGQSNMQFSVRESEPKPDTATFYNASIRLFSVDIATDFVPRSDLKGGRWQTATADQVKAFSAVGFYFGSYLQQHLGVPIGLISSCLGATSIEQWMSNEAIAALPQFDPFYKAHLQPAKSMQQLEKDFEKIKANWNKRYYLKDDPGLKDRWYLPRTNVNEWQSMQQPSHWDDNELRDYDGSVWFRRSFDNFPRDFTGSATVSLGQVDDYNICWVNGTKIGEGYGHMNMYTYTIPESVLKPRDNIVVVRVFDAGGRGGMYNMFWSPFFAGTWRYKKGVQINAARFKRPQVPNAYIFGTPTILYNANIAPITSMAVKGFVWYQGEANTGRAAEYKQLLPLLITDWRKQFKQGELPFLVVQLPNLGKEPSQPEDSEWAELREAQAAALQLPATGLAVTIDIGEADNLHPPDKLAVGKRLAMTALCSMYQVDSIQTSPQYQHMQIKGDSIIIGFDQDLICKDKYGYIRGFSIAGKDHIFHWAKATIRTSQTISVHSSEVTEPVAVRYLWSGAPGAIDLYNASGLPVAPFRTDDFRRLTEGKTYHYEP